MQGVGYRLNLKTRECEKFPLHEPWRPVEVPVNTTLENTFYLGSVDAANNYVKMNAYHGYTDRGKAICYCKLNFITHFINRILPRFLDNRRLYPIYPLIPCN